MSQTGTSSWPPSNGLTTKVIPRDRSILQIFGSAKINAPASLVFEIVCNTADYPAWNTFVPRSRIESQPTESRQDSKVLVKGTAFTFYPVMDMAQPVKLVVSDVSTPENPSDYITPDILQKDQSLTKDLKNVYRISWKNTETLMAKGLQVERFHEIIVTGQKECEVRTWECYGGVIAYAIKWLLAKNLNDKFQDWCDDLKKVSEERWKNESV